MYSLKDNFRAIAPYLPGEQPQCGDMIKLNTNENPYPPSPMVKEALKNIECNNLKLYPDPSAAELTDALAEYHGIGRENIFVGVGSDDVIAMCFMAFFNSGKPILFPDITYAFYDVWAQLFKIKYENPALDNDFKIVKDNYYAENGGIVFPNPNAPTGILMGVNDIRDILEHNKNVIVIIDEAYIDFGGESVISLIREYKNLVVTRTFSKSRSMAGMRIGYAAADEALIRELNNVKNSYNSYTLSMPAIKLGTASVKDDAYFKDTIAKITATRERVKKELTGLGFKLTESASNFLFVLHHSINAGDLFKKLRDNNIFVRYFNSPRIDNYLRITIGTDDEMDKLLDFLRAYITEDMG